MEKVALDLIKRFAHIINGTRVLNQRTEVIRTSEIHPIYANFHAPIAKMARLGMDESLDFDACEAFKAKYLPVAFFPGRMENNFPWKAFPIYLVVPWNCAIPALLNCVRGLVLFNRVDGPDKIYGPCFDNEFGQWGAVLFEDEIALKNFPYQEHDRSLEMALGSDWRDIEWLRSLLLQDKIFYEPRK